MIVSSNASVDAKASTHRTSGFDADPTESANTETADCRHPVVSVSEREAA